MVVVEAAVPVRPTSIAAWASALMAHQDAHPIATEKPVATTGVVEAVVHAPPVNNVMGKVTASPWVAVRGDL